MTFKRFFGFGFLAWLAGAVLKVLFFKFVGLDSIGSQVLFGMLLFVFIVAFCRRLGVINYLEAVMAAVVWFIIAFVLDFVVTAQIVGVTTMYRRWPTWVSYLLLLITVFLFHKKRHVHVRRELHAHHHAGHGHGGHEQHGHHGGGGHGGS